MIKILEEFFDNGARFETFNPLFQPSLNKKTFLAIVNKYYGRVIVLEGIPWLKGKELPASMLPRDYSDVTFKSWQTFYGNDAECLFKYFVSQDDPQSIFVADFYVLSW